MLQLCNTQPDVADGVTCGTAGSCDGWADLEVVTATISVDIGVRVDDATGARDTDAADIGVRVDDATGARDADAADIGVRGDDATVQLLHDSMLLDQSSCY